MSGTITLQDAGYITLEPGVVSSIFLEVTAAPDAGQPPLLVYFSAFASGGTPPYSFFWAFGDGTTSTQQNPVHVYPLAGQYLGSCTLRDSAGDHTEVSPIPITVSPVIPPATFTPLPGQSCAGGAPAPIIPYNAPPQLQELTAPPNIQAQPSDFYDRCVGEYVNYNSETITSPPPPLTYYTITLLGA
jgi:PKD repeat protein